MAMSWNASAQMLGVSFEVDTVFGGPSPDFDPDGVLEGYTSYLVYANFTNPTDVLGSIYADTAVFTDAAPLQINAPCGCWNPDEASMVIGPSINPAFDPFFPRLNSMTVFGPSANFMKLTKVKHRAGRPARHHWRKFL